jgi:hypothetical protein
MRRIALSSLVISAVLAASGPASADPAPVVIELFTSQGCSSCPPADELVKHLAERQDVLPLAFHVDYWDYIGWADIFADPAYTDRQRGYAHVGGRNMIYTPQMIIMGREDVVGADVMEVSEALSAYLGQKPKVQLTTGRSEEQLTVSAPALPDGMSGQFRVQLVRYMPLERVEIKRGELAGNTVDYANIVESLEVLADWTGAEPLEVTATFVGDLPAAVLVQEWPFGPIFAAARVE